MQTLIKTQVANLYKCEESGNYFLRAKILGKPVKKSLKTKNFAVAQTLLRRKHEELTAKIDMEHRPVNTCMFGELMDEWLKRDGCNEDIKDSTKLYHKECTDIIERTLSGVRISDASRVTEVECKDWAREIRANYSATRYNGTIDVLRGIFALAVEQGSRLNNPAKAIPKAKVRRKPIELPSSEQFQQLLKHLDSHGRRKSAGQVVRFLVYGGPRISSARAVYPHDIDLKHNEIVFRKTKNDKVVRVPMIPEMKQLVEELLKDYPGHGPLLPIKNPKRALQTACDTLKIPRLTNHHLRHLFTTTCLESGIDVRTVAEWRGDSDHGAMLLKTYAHARRDHSQNMAKLLKF